MIIPIVSSKGTFNVIQVCFTHVICTHDNHHGGIPTESGSHTIQLI